VIPVSIESLLSRSAPGLGEPLDVASSICVSPPYFALSGLRQTAPGEVSAGISAEAGPMGQAASIGIGEVGRHLAILGLCGAAAVNPRAGRHFYLARTARLQWLAPAGVESAPDASWLRGHARARFTSLRNARADTELTDLHGRVLARAQLEYQVITTAAFARLFASAATGPGIPGPPVPALAASPHGRALPLTALRCDRRGVLTAEVEVSADMCAGHFDGFPMLPVAATGSAMAGLLDHFVRRLTGNPAARWLTRTADIAAERFVPAGSAVTFTVRPNRRSRTTHSFHCDARTGTGTIATATFTITIDEA
jgi:3-hydroxymyristoyl/3-hydroxydecanoyl-(acyl carrier protein) dehydratase